MDVNQIFFQGHNKYGQAGIGQDEHNKKYIQPKQIVFKTFIKQVSCGNHHSALLTIDGLIYTMGSNIHGTLGLGNAGNINYAFKPTLIKQLKDVDQVISGSYHMCAIKGGQLYTWGKGIDGQLGHGNMKNIFTPTKVQSLGNDVELVSCGMNHTLVTINKSINNFNGYAFGSGIYGQLGCGSNRSYNYPINIKLSNIEMISAGQNHSLFISEDKAYGCGDNSCFQVGNFEDSTKNKKYILQPIKLQYFQNEEINFIECYSLSVVLTSNNKAFIWGGKVKIWPPRIIDQKQIMNLKVTNEKLYYINGDNDLLSITIKNNQQMEQQKQVILSNRNVLDFDASQNHLFAIGDIVAQTEYKQQSSTLSIWIGQSLCSSKQTFSKKSISHKSQSEFKEEKLSINKKIQSFFFTKHLKSGISEQQSLQNESEIIQRQIVGFQSCGQSLTESDNYKNSIQTSKTSPNISSQIQTQSKNPLQINKSETKTYFQERTFLKQRDIVQQVQQLVEPFTVESLKNQTQNKKYSQTKLQKLMDQMELKTVHLKKKYPSDKLLEQKKMIKTPSSYIKKEPQNFVMESQKIIDLNTPNLDPKISNFEDKLQIGIPLKEINVQNQLNIKQQNKQNINKKSKAKSIIYYNEKQNRSEDELQTSGCFRQSSQNKQKECQTIEEIFIQLLKKQKQQKTSNQKITKVLLHRDLQKQKNREKRLSYSCITSKTTEPQTSRFQKDQSHENQLPKLVPIATINRSPIHQNKMTISKISQISNISGKSNFKRNTDLLQISRSNRQLRFQLRDRDLKISNLQEELSKKQIEVQMLYKQLQYFKNLGVVCPQCGNQTNIDDPFASV